MTRGWLLLTAAIGGCASAAADHERLGDRAYREGQWETAVAEYRAAVKGHGTARTYAKLGSAALHQGDPGMAIGAFAALQDADPTRAAEAAAGLERAAEFALRGGSAQASNLAMAVHKLRVLAPGRPLGRFALASTAGLDATEALSALPAALAAASESRAVDSLLVTYGEAQRVTTACEAATHTYSVVLRRSREPPLRATAALGIAACGLRLGLDALAGEQAESAEHWLQSAVAAAPATPFGWRAAIGLGDARLTQGDVLGAAIAYQSVLSAASVPDSLTTLATEKLNALTAAPPGEAGPSP